MPMMQNNVGMQAPTAVYINPSDKMQSHQQQDIKNATNQQRSDLATSFATITTAATVI